MRKRSKAFTLAEMLVVMGIIILFIAMAVPAVRALTGSSSISVARNELASLVNRAREEAVALQDVRGVVFFVDPASDRVVGVICQAATIQEQSLAQQNIILLDALPGKDSLVLPPGTRLQTIFNGASERFMGYNPLTTTVAGASIGGCILFDANGKLIVKQYGFQMAQPNPSGTGGASSTLCTMLFGATATSNGVGATAGVSTNSYYFLQGGTSGSTTGIPFSQLGMVLFDQDAFRSLGYTDQDGSPLGNSSSEATEETWIDTHSTPVLINRFDGTLIKAE